MGRHENDNIEYLDLPESDVYTEFYGKDGNQLQDYDKNVCAKKLLNRKTGKINYYILSSNNGDPYDPNNTSVSYNRRNIWKFRHVSSNTFSVYKRFLETKYQSLLLQAKRGIQ